MLLLKKNERKALMVSVLCMIILLWTSAYSWVYVKSVPPYGLALTPNDYHLLQFCIERDFRTMMIQLRWRECRIHVYWIIMLKPSSIMWVNPYIYEIIELTSYRTELFFIFKSYYVAWCFSLLIYIFNI